MVCWLVCAGWVCGTRTFLNAVWCFGCIEMDRLACDCVQLCGFLFFPVGLRELFIFLCSNFLDASMSLCVVCGGLFFCWVSGFSRPVSDVVLKFFCGEFDPGSGRTLAACLTHASRTERPCLQGTRVANG